MLQRLDKIPDGHVARKCNSEHNRQHERPKLIANRAAHLGHSGIVRVSQASRKFRQLEEAGDSFAQLDARSLCVPVARNAKAIKNYPRSIRAIERIKVNSPDISFLKIVGLLHSI